MKNIYNKPKREKIKMSEKTLYIHIGTPKTGTTVIQHFLRTNRALFDEKSFMLYTAQDGRSDRNLRFLTVYLNVFGAIELINRGLLPKHRSSHKKILNNWYTNFLKDIKQSKCNNILMSEEMLWWAVCGKEKMLHLLKDLRNDFKVKIIVYLRRQDYYIMSMYQQSLKAGDCHGMRCFEWIKAPDNLQISSYSRYAENLKWLSEIIGKENMIIRIYEKEQFKEQSIFCDFMDTIKLELSDEFIIPEKNINDGLSPLVAELARSFSKNNSEKNNFMRLFLRYKATALFNGPGDQHDFLSPAERCNLLSRYEDGNRYIAGELLGRENGRLFYEAPPNPDEVWKPYELSLDDALSFLLKVADKQDMELQSLINRRHNNIRRLKLLYGKLPLPLQYPLRKTWCGFKLLKAKLFKESI